MIRVCHIISKLSYGGVQSVILNYYKNIDKSQIRFDFIVFEQGAREVEEFVIGQGSIVYRVTNIRNKLKYFKEVKDILINNSYDIVHSHLNFLNIIPLVAAKRSNVKTRISHSHNNYKAKNILTKAMRIAFRLLISRYATHFFACSSEANNWLHGIKNSSSNQSIILNNAIDLEKYQFSKQVRDELREVLSIPNEAKVLINVGSISKTKNQIFLLKLMRECISDNKLFLILIGDGPELDRLIDFAKKNNINKKVIFFGKSNEVYKLLNTADIFVLPSLNEGLPVVLIEAQSNGLPLLISDRVTREVDILGNSIYLPLTESIIRWKKSIYILNRDYTSTIERMKEGGFDIVHEANRLASFYIEQSNI